MAKFEDPKAALAAQGLPEFPIGTLDELKAANLPPSMFPSCAEPQMDGTVKGCQFWHGCFMSYKGLSAKDGGGPRNHCLQILKSAENGGGIVRSVRPCYKIVAKEDEYRENGAQLEIIADEGESFERITFIAKPKPSDITNREQDTITDEVKPFVRLAENKKTAAQVMRANIFKKEKDRVRKEGAAQAFGLTEGVTPLDKRGKGSRGGVAEKGGSNP